MNFPRDELALPAMRRQSHPHCFVCGPENGRGLGLEFRLTDGGAVESSFACEPVFAGYPEMVHGGIICTLLDGAMTNCLFAHGLVAVTVDLNIRFQHPLAISRMAAVRARLDSAHAPVHHLSADVVQDGEVVASATGRFLEQRAMCWFKPKVT